MNTIIGIDEVELIVPHLDIMHYPELLLLEYHRISMYRAPGSLPTSQRMPTNARPW